MTTEERTIVNIIYTAYRINDRLSYLLSPLGISVQQYNILRILRGQYPQFASVNLLKDRMLDKNSGVSRLVEKLRRKGLVSCAVHKPDRRRTEVKISTAGLKMLEDIASVISNLHQATKILAPANLSSLNHYLDKLRSNLPAAV